MLQPIRSHADFDRSDCPLALLVDVLVRNSSTEMWLGIHMFSTPASQEGPYGDRARGPFGTLKIDKQRVCGKGRHHSQPPEKSRLLFVICDFGMRGRLINECHPRDVSNDPFGPNGIDEQTQTELRQRQQIPGLVR